MPQSRVSPQLEVPGLAVRRIAADILDGVLRRHIALDEQFAGKNQHPALSALVDRDRALTRRLVVTVLRRLVTLRKHIGELLEKGFPTDAPRVETILLLGAAQILLLDVPDHAAVDLSVRLAQADRRAIHYASLVNAVLRRLARNRTNINIDAAGPDDTPAWLLAHWTKAYGADKAFAIASANHQEPGLDLTIKQDAEYWAEQLHGRVLPTGTVRTLAAGIVTSLPGFAEAAWWVQDAAASIPARLLGDVRDREIADLCAAPGGKTAQLCVAGARVTAVDRSPARLNRLSENLQRLALTANIVAADVLNWRGGPFDAILLDAPCSSTGTIRRHPDIPLLKKEADIGVLASLQKRLLDHAITLLKPGGTLVYCVCSLEPEEGEHQAEALLARNAKVVRKPISVDEVFGHAEFINTAGDLRTLPIHLPDPDARWGGLDGFFATRITLPAP